MSYSDVLLTEETRERLMHYYGLDKPLVVQYWHYVKNLFRGEMGISIRHNMKVSKLILQSLPWTLLLMGVGFFLATVLGISLGAFSAWKRGSKADRILMFSMVALSRILFLSWLFLC